MPPLQLPGERVADIPLSEYLAFLFQEISRARDAADRYSKQIALNYASDPLLKTFPVPRFKVPKLELSIPVLVSRVNVSSATRFTMSASEFSRLIGDKLDAVVARVRSDGTPDGPAPALRMASRAALEPQVRAAGMQDAIDH